MVRCQMNFKRLSLTDIKIDIKRVPKKKTLIEAMNAAGNDMWKKWELFSIFDSHLFHYLNFSFDGRC